MVFNYSSAIENGLSSNPYIFMMQNCNWTSNSLNNYYTNVFVPSLTYRLMDIEQLKASLFVLPKDISTSGKAQTTNTGTYNYAGNTSDTGNTTVENGQSDLKSGLFKGRLAGQEATVTRLCKKYNLSTAFVASIIGLESGWGTSNLAYHNNFGGYRKAGDAGVNGKGFGFFSTIEKGLEAMISNLARYTRFKDVSAVNFQNINAIAKHYCNSGWASKVMEVYRTRVSKYLA